MTQTITPLRQRMLDDMRLGNTRVTQPYQTAPQMPDLNGFFANNLISTLMIEH